MKSQFYYEEVYEKFRADIIEGVYKKGDKLPSMRAVSRQMNLSVNTISMAYYQLEQEGFITGRERSGFYVEEVEKLTTSQSQVPTGASQEVKKHLPYAFTFDGVDATAFDYDNFARSFKDAVQMGEEAILERGDGRGDGALRTSLARYLKISRNIQARPEQIIISSGSDELFLLLSLLFPEEVFGFENPGYSFRGNGFATKNNSIPLPLDEQGISLADLEASEVDILSITPSRQFPLTTIMPINRRIQVLNWAHKKKNRYIIEDDYDSEFKYNLKPIPPLKVMDVGDRVIYLGNFSRIMAPSLRISYMVLPETLLQEKAEVISALHCPVSRFLQRATALFIDRGHLEKQVNRMRVLYRKKYELILSLLREREIAVLSKDSGTSIVIALPHVEPSSLLDALREEGVMITPVTHYSYQGLGHEGEYLLGFVSLDETEIREGISRLSQVYTSLLP